VCCSVLQHAANTLEGPQMQRERGLWNQHCIMLKHTAIHYSTLQHITTHYATLQRTATHCNTLQHTATHLSILLHMVRIYQPAAPHCTTLQHTATHCNTLQHTVTHDDTLQQIASHRNSLQHMTCSAPEVGWQLFFHWHKLTAKPYNKLRHIALHCTTLQHNATN